MISIIMPTHNRPPMIDMTLLSVLSQDYDDYEFIVVDVSPDKYFEDYVDNLLNVNPIFSMHKEKRNRVKIVHADCNPRLLGAVRTAGVKNAVQDNDMVVFLDHDDFLGNCLLKYINVALRQYPDTELISTNYTSFCYSDGNITTNMTTFMGGDVCGSSDTIWVGDMYFKFQGPQDIYKMKHPWKTVSCPKIISKKAMREHRFSFIEDTETMDDVAWSVLTHSLVETYIPIVGYVYVCYSSGYLTNSCDPKNTPSETAARYAEICKQYGEMLDEMHYVKHRNEVFM